ncbi:MAG: hypothetical protein Q8930_19380 [Bacillota bacterium]|nr:hypothetical protein [Bacillota bacterium]
MSSTKYKPRMYLGVKAKLIEFDGKSMILAMAKGYVGIRQGFKKPFSECDGEQRADAEEV